MKRALVLVVLFGFAALPVFPQADFSGTWKLNVAESKFGSIPPPRSITEKIVHKEDRLELAIHQVSSQGELEAELVLLTDGSESKNRFGGTDLSSWAAWEGEILKCKHALAYQGMNITLTDRWELSEDGKSLTVTRSILSDYGAEDQKLIFSRE